MKKGTEILKFFTVSSLFTLIFVFSFLITPFRFVTAQTAPNIIVAPARQELTINPGERSALNVSFYNTSDLPLSGILKVADFVVTDKEGSPRIIEDVNQASPKFTASAWFTLPYDRITIAANDKVAIQTTLNIPADARPGGRYVAIYFEPVSAVPKALGTERESGAAVSYRIASLVYIKVAGPITENALVSRFFARSFYEYGPIEVDTEILNRGDYHITPRGMISLTNAFGCLTAQDKLKEQNIFPDAIRSYKNSLGQKWMFGRYRLDLAAAYGDRGQALTSMIYVWVFPWKITMVVLLALIIIVLLTNSIYKKLVVKETFLEEEVEKEKDEIEKLKEQLRKRRE